MRISLLICFKLANKEGCKNLVLSQSCQNSYITTKRRGPNGCFLRSVLRWKTVN